MRRIYLDHNASTPLRPRARVAMERAQSIGFGNPGSMHAEGRAARRIVEDAREATASALGVSPEEIVFTSGATESNATAIFGLFRSENAEAAVVATAVEHACVLESTLVLSKTGRKRRLLAVDSEGRLDLSDLDSALRSPCAGVCVMAANNETGAVQPIVEAAEACARMDVPLHVDAAQVPGRLDIPWGDLPGRVSIALSGHKCGGPKGVGALRVPKASRFSPLLVGGGQERDRRAGTENVPAIAGFAEALLDARDEGADRAVGLAAAEAAFFEALDRSDVDYVRNGPKEAKHRLPGVVNLRFPGRRGDAVVMGMDLEGVALGLGAACSSGAAKPSHVLLAMGLPKQEVLESLRLSFGWTDDAETALDAAGRFISLLRRPE
jgi:cysteine desulfurase